MSYAFGRRAATAAVSLAVAEGALWSASGPSGTELAGPDAAAHGSTGACFPLQAGRFGKHRGRLGQAHRAGSAVATAGRADATSPIACGTAATGTGTGSTVGGIVPGR